MIFCNKKYINLKANMIIIFLYMKWNANLFAYWLRVFDPYFVRIFDSLRRIRT